MFCEQKNPYSYEAEETAYSELQRSPWVPSEHLVLLGDGDHLVVGTEDQAARFLLISGKPLREPVAWYCRSARARRNTAGTVRSGPRLPRRPSTS